MSIRNTPRYLVLFSLVSIIALMVPLLACGCEASQPEPQAQPVVKKVDHIAISCTDPGALFSVFTQTLGLPEAWPLSSYPGFTTGGIYCGNANIETLQLEGSGEDSGGPPPTTAFFGIVFESYPISQVMDEFKQRGADPGDPKDQMQEFNGQQVKVWTNVTLNGLCTDYYIVYLCEYTQQAEEHLEQRAQANPVPLGGIGLLGVKEITVASTQTDQTRALWKAVFAPAPMSSDGEMTFDSGPSVLISEGDMDVITGLVLEVDNLQAAQDFLAQNGLLGEVSDGQVSIAPDAVQGLYIVLVEK
ncbi:MAG: hypothetical protein JW854_05040 [Actinobacteria bacterium]|nr:hypothetical protein [Actinomycetota bacterium]